MFIYFFCFIVISILILINAITDAPNAIATIVGTNVLTFKKAAKFSAVCNLIGIIIMCFINFSVANCISSLIQLTGKNQDIIVLISSMLSVIFFSLFAMKYGIPTSETHGLISGLVGSTIAINGIKTINFKEIENIVFGLVWSIIGTIIVCNFVSLILKKYVYKISKAKIKKYQILGCAGMSFMHGAQDGQKFIGVLILFLSIISKNYKSISINPLENIWSIIFVAILMAIGVSIGGKNIVQNIGSDVTRLKNEDALLSDISTIISLFFASVMGFPVSTSHVKTMSIVGIGKVNKLKIENKKVIDIFKAWVLTFPICGILGYILTLILNKVF